MKVKIQAGAELDLLNKDELENCLTAFERRMLGGIQYRKALATVQADTTGALSTTNVGVIGGGGTELGPNQGYVWSVRRLVVIPQLAAPQGNVAVFTNGNSYSDLEIASQNVPFSQLLSSEAFMMFHGDTLVLQGANLGNQTMLTLKALVAEVAVEEIAKL